MGYTGLHLSVVPFIHLSSCLSGLSVLFCSLHKATYITNTAVGVKSDFLTVLVSFQLQFLQIWLMSIFLSSHDKVYQ